MDMYGIERALVSYSLAREFDLIEGNKMLLDEIKNDACLDPVWVAIPHHTNEFPAPEELIVQMKEANVKAITLCPTAADYFFSLAEWNCGELYSALEEHNIPLLLDMNSVDREFEVLFKILSAHPKLKLLFTNVTYRVSRNLYPLMKKFPNLYVETSGIKGQDVIQDMCEVFGAGRLIFGSNMPLGSGASAVALITYSNISASDKERIASENLNELLGGVLL